MTRNWSNKLRRAAQCGLLLALLAGCKGRAHGPTAEAPAQPVAATAAAQYTCPMHPQIVRDAPGPCPICGMNLVPKATGTGGAPADTAGTGLGHLTAAPNASVVSGIATVRPSGGTVAADTFALPGTVEYDPRRSRVVAARVGGRVERLFVRFNYQPVRRGQKLLELYSPELVTAEQELIFLLANDAENVALLSGARQKLRLLGLTDGQLRQLARTRRPEYRVAVFSPYDGYVVENQGLAGAAPVPAASAGMAAAPAPGGAGMGSAMAAPAGSSEPAIAPTVAATTPLVLTEGAYVATGQTLFEVMNTAQVWGIFQPAPEQLAQLRPGQALRVRAEGSARPLLARVALVEPEYRAGASVAAVRVYLPNPDGALRRGTRLSAQVVAGSPAAGLWLPRTAVVDLGTRQVAFVRRGRTFVPVPVRVGQRSGGQVQILSGLAGTDDVAANGQYLIDSESFIQANANASILPDDDKH